MRKLNGVPEHIFRENNFAVPGGYLKVGDLVLLPFRVVNIYPECKGNMNHSLENVNLDYDFNIDSTDIMLEAGDLFEYDGFLVTEEELLNMFKEVSEKNEK